MEGLGLPCDWVGVGDKLLAFRELVASTTGSIRRASPTSAMGAKMFRCSKRWGFPIAVADAHKSARQAAKFVTEARGGDHALEEVIDLIFEAREGVA